MSQLAKGLSSYPTDATNSEPFSRHTEGFCIFNVQELAEPIVETIWDNVNISMADVDCDIMLDQIDINLILGPIGYQILDGTENGRVLDDDQVHPMSDCFCHRLLTDI